MFVSTYIPPEKMYYIFEGDDSDSDSEDEVFTTFYGRNKNDS